MHQLTRLEINIRRLLARCELMAKDDPHKNWKLEKFILALDDMIKQLQALPNNCKPSKDAVIGYVKRIDFLKGLVNTTKLANPVDRVVAVQMLSKNSSTYTDSIGPSITTQIHQKTSAKYNKELRAELFNDDKGESGVRHRLSSTNVQDEDLDALLKYNRNIQEKIAENMLSMTSTMKEHALAASEIIRKDIGLIDKSDKLSDVNVTKLKTESLKLAEHTNSNWRCWMWVMIAFVLVVFFNMVLFMKVAKKRV